MHSLTLHRDDLAFAESLYSLLMEANNHSNQRHALQSRTYGKIQAALVEALQVAFIGPDRANPSEQEWAYARQLADLVYTIMLDSGTNVTESLEGMEGYWCEDCSEFHTGYCDSRVKQQQQEDSIVDEKCEHGFSLLGRCPVGCTDDKHGEDGMLGGVDEKETGWTGR